MGDAEETPVVATSRRLRVTIKVPVPAWRLWQSMWRPDILERWWDAGADLTLVRYGDATLPDWTGATWRGTVKSVSPDDGPTRVLVLERIGDPQQRLTVRVWPAGSGRTKVRVVAEGVDDVDAAVRFLQRRLNRLARWGAGVRDRESAPAQAVIVIHGIGEQQPGETLKAFVDGLFPPSAVPPLIRRYKPDLLDDTFELRRVSIDPRNAGYPRTDLYELYWAHLMPGSQLSDITGWAAHLLWRSPRRMPSALRGWWFVIWALVVVVVGCAVAGMVGWLAALPAWLLSSGAAIAAVWGVVKAPVMGTFVGFVADAARYLSPTPRNILRRQQIRGAGVRLLERLHDAQRYDRIVVFGHSLGSVVAYDIVSIAWMRAHRRHASPRTTKLHALKYLEGLLGQGAPDPAHMRTLQADAWEEHRRNTQPWLVTDLVTAGSPLAHAELLLSTRKDPVIGPLVDERVLPADPPAGEMVEGARRISWYLPYVETLSRNRRKLLIPDHASPFAVTRWTNLHFTTKGLRGDPVGGVIPQVLGRSVTNVELPVPPGAGFAHTRYWTTLTDKERRRDPAATDPVQALADALALTAAQELTQLNRSLPAHLLTARETG